MLLKRLNVTLCLPEGFINSILVLNVPSIRRKKLFSLYSETL